jgi:DNA-binding NtrC family response regulator
LQPEFLPIKLRELASGASAEPPAQGSPMSPFYGFIQAQIQAGTQSLYTDTIARVERILLTSVLSHTGGNKSQAAQILGMTRGFLRNKIREHCIRISHSASLDDEDDEVEASLGAPRT